METAATSILKTFGGLVEHGNYNFHITKNKYEKDQYISRLLHNGLAFLGM